MSIGLPNTLTDIITKVRRIIGRPSQTQIADVDIIKYINTFYVYDMPEHLKMESLRYNYEFLTTANRAVYDLPTDTYLTCMPPVFIAGYQSYMTQSRENFFRVNPELNFIQNAITVGNNTAGPYVGQLTAAFPNTNTNPQNNPSVAILQGYKPNPPGAFSTSVGISDIPAKFLQWNVIISALGTPDATSGVAPSISLVDDGQGNLFDPADTSTAVANRRGTVNYLTGAVSINAPPSGFAQSIPAGNNINAQYIPYTPSRPQSAMFFQDQIILYPIPDQAYTVSFEVYKYPVSFSVSANGTFNGTLQPQLNEWWQLLAYGAADKIFADNADFESMAKFRPLLDEQMNLCLRRTIVQQTSERAATIYTENNNGNGMFGFGNLFSGF
jgi:hypothetical protein